MKNMQRTKVRKKNERPKTIREIINERIDYLLAYAIKIAKKNPEYAIKYIKMAKKISIRNKVPITSKRKQLFCKYCNFPYIKGHFKIQKEKEFVLFLCLKCGKCYRIHQSKLIEKYYKMRL